MHLFLSPGTSCLNSRQDSRPQESVHASLTLHQLVEWGLILETLYTVAPKHLTDYFPLRWKKIALFMLMSTQYYRWVWSHPSIQVSYSALSPLINMPMLWYEALAIVKKRPLGIGFMEFKIISTISTPLPPLSPGSTDAELLRSLRKWLPRLRKLIRLNERSVPFY